MWLKKGRRGVLEEEAEGRARPDADDRRRREGDWQESIVIVVM